MTVAERKPEQLESRSFSRAPTTRAVAPFRAARFCADSSSSVSSAARTSSMVENVKVARSTSVSALTCDASLRGAQGARLARRRIFATQADRSFSGGTLRASAPR